MMKTKGIALAMILALAMSVVLNLKFARAQPLVGDLNDDGHVDISDAIIAGNAFGSTPIDTNWNADADLNDDNVVNIMDLILLASAFG